MPDSLILAGLFELMPQGGGPYTQTFELIAGYDLGAPVPVTSTVAGMMLDGDRQAGVRTGNRALVLPVLINSPDRLDLARFTDQIMAAVNVAAFTLQWSPSGGLPLIWDCFRATTKVTWNKELETQNGVVFQRVIEIDCAALPFGRSPDPQTVTAQLAPLLLDGFATAPTGAYSDTTVATQPGGASARLQPWWGWQHAKLQPATGGTISRTITGANLNIYDTVSAKVLHTPATGSARLDFSLTLSATSISGGAQYQQSTSVFAQPSSTSLALAYPAANNAGDLLICAVSCDTTNSPTITVTDSAGNTWGQQSTITNTGEKQMTAVFCVPNCAGAANTVTAHFSTSSSWRYLTILEYSGMVSSGVLDVQHAATGQGTTASSGNATTTLNADLIIGVVHNDSQGSVVSPGAGFTSRNVSSDGTLLVEELIQPAAGPIAATATFPTSQFYSALVVAFKAVVVTSVPGSVTMTATDSYAAGDTSWHPITFSLPDNQGVLGNVTSYSLSVLVTASAGQPKDFTPVWYDDMFAQSAAANRISTTNGTVLTIPGILGSARAPANLTVTSPTAGTAMLIHRPPVGQDPNLQILTAMPPTLGAVATIPVAGSNFAGTYSAVVPIIPTGTGAQSTTLNLYEWIGPNLATQDVASGGEISGTPNSFSGLNSTPTVISPGLRNSASRVRFTNGGSSFATADTWGGICGFVAAGPVNKGVAPVIPGQPHTFQVELGSGTSGTVMQVGLMWYDANLALISTSAKTNGTLTGGTLVVTGTVTAPSTAYYAALRVTNVSTIPASMTMDVDAIQIEQNTVSTTWVFPAQIGGQSLTFPWFAGTLNPRYVVLGEVTLPLAATDSGAVFHMQAALSDANNNSYSDLLLLDTQGEMVWVQGGSTAYTTLFIDEPDPTVGIGNILIDYGQQGKPSAASVANLAVISGGPIALEPGSNTLLAHSLAGAPGVAATVYPRWMAERSA